MMNVLPDPAADSPAGRLRREAGAEDWEAAREHRFVRELFAGTVPDAVLADYLVQDYLFFEDFLAMLGACVAHADTIDAKLRFATQLGMLADDEDGYFRRAFERLGVSAADRAAARPHRAAAGFAELMRGAVARADYAHLLVMLVVAECLYLDWASRPGELPADPLHAEWITLHRGEGFRRWCGFLVGELDRVHPEPGSPAARELARRWERAVALERDFFEVPYERAAGSVPAD